MEPKQTMWRKSNFFVFMGCFLGHDSRKLVGDNHRHKANEIEKMENQTLKSITDLKIYMTCIYGYRDYNETSRKRFILLQAITNYGTSRFSVMLKSFNYFCNNPNMKVAKIMRCMHF